MSIREVTASKYLAQSKWYQAPITAHFVRSPSPVLGMASAGCAALFRQLDCKLLQGVKCPNLLRQEMLQILKRTII